MRFISTLVIVFGLATVAFAKGPKITDPQLADEDFAFQGEYVGELSVDGTDVPVGAQVIAMGNGNFDSVGYVGGLPGAGWDGSEKHPATGKRDGDTVVLSGDDGRAEIKDGIMSVSIGGMQVGSLKKIERKSPTLGAKPPKNAIVLFDGTSVDQWKNGRMENGLLMQGTTSKRTFQSHKLHIEFRLPYQPLDRGQARGNSGLYLQSRYEVQMLDSFGLEGKHNECGGIYSIKDPDVNMCFPPLTWQTYDVEFIAGKFDSDGNMTAKPRITVRHNGVVIHDRIELPKSTTAAPLKPGPEPGPVYLQDHGCPVRYRNIWVVEL